MTLPDTESPEWEKMVEFMRADLANDMGYTKIINAARESIEARGGNFNEELKKWKKSKGSCDCKKWSCRICGHPYCEHLLCKCIE